MKGITHDRVQTELGKPAAKHSKNRRNFGKDYPNSITRCDKREKESEQARGKLHAKQTRHGTEDKRGLCFDKSSMQHIFSRLPSPAGADKSIFCPIFRGL